MNWNNGVNTHPMKWRPRLKVWKSSNNVFDPKKMCATSYGWWQYFGKINGKTVFNNYCYSPATSRHQEELKAVLKKLKIKIDVVLSTQDGLHRVDRSWIEDEYKTLFLDQWRLENEKLHPRTAEKLRDAVKATEERIAKLKAIGLKVSGARLKLLKKQSSKAGAIDLQRRIEFRKEKAKEAKILRDMSKNLLEGSWKNS